VRFGLRRGISPVIATVIIVAVALVLAVAVVGWIMGLWGSVTGGQEQLKIMPTSYIYFDETRGWVLHLEIQNTGSGDAAIMQIEVGSADVITDFSSATPQGDCIPSGNMLIVKAGGFCKVELMLGAQYTPGATYHVKIYTKSGGVYPGDVVAKASSGSSSSSSSGTGLS